MTDRRIVITGIGVISPLGNDLASTWQAVKAGRSGIDTIKSMDVTGYSTKIAGEVKDFDPRPVLRRRPRTPACVDPLHALCHGRCRNGSQGFRAGSGSGRTKPASASWVGSGIGGLGTLESQHATLLSEGPAQDDCPPS